MFPKDDRFEPLPSETPEYSEISTFDSSNEWRAAPLSHFFGLPTLSHRPAKSKIVPFDNRSSFGMKLLSEKSTPLSSMLGLPVLKAWNANKTSSFGLPLLKAWKPNKTTSFGLPLLSKGR